MQAPNDIEHRKQEIHGLISGNKVDHAVKRLMDYVRDFSDDTGDEHEVIVISANYHELETDKRRGTVGLEQFQHHRSKLLYQALDLLENVERKLAPQIRV